MCIIIGTIVLGAILTFVSNPCLFPQTMVVTADCFIYELHPGENQSIFNITLTVNTQDSYPITDAQVIIKGLHGIGAGYTDIYGQVCIPIFVELEQGRYEGYLDVSVKAPCYKSFLHQDMIKIVRML